MDSLTKADAAHYNDTVVRQFSIMAVVWGVVGMLVGVFIAAQLAWPELNFNIPWLSYGRLRPLHTNAVIFAFGGSALIGTSYYVVQRTCQVRLFGGPLVRKVKAGPRSTWRSLGSERRRPGESLRSLRGGCPKEDA